MRLNKTFRWTGIPEQHREEGRKERPSVGGCYCYLFNLIIIINLMLLAGYHTILRSLISFKRWVDRCCWSNDFMVCYWYLLNIFVKWLLVIRIICPVGTRNVLPWKSQVFRSPLKISSFLDTLLLRLWSVHRPKFVWPIGTPCEMWSTLCRPLLLPMSFPGRPSQFRLDLPEIINMKY